MKFSQINCPIYNIVGDLALSSTEIGEGRFLPGIVIDAGSNSDVSDLIKFQQTTPPGDVKLQWGKTLTLFNSGEITLSLKMLQPMEIEFAISFKVSIHYALIDGIIQNRAFYLQIYNENKEAKIYAEKLLIEVPEMGFDKRWKGMLLTTVKSKYRKKRYTNKDAMRLAQAEIKGMREIWNTRR